MTVYIEIAFLDNFTMDAVILWAASYTLQKRCAPARIVVGAAIGACMAILTSLTSGGFSFVLKAMTLLLMCVATVGLGKRLFWFICLVLAYTFVLGGAIAAVFELLCIDYSLGYYSAKIPLFVFFIGVLIAFFCCYAVKEYLAVRKKIQPYLRQITVCFGDSAVAACGFCDSGNTLTHNGVPVCFVTAGLCGFKEYFARQVLSSNAVQIRVFTIAGEATVTAIEGKISGGGAVVDVLLALPLRRCPSEYDVILNSVFCVD